MAVLKYVDEKYNHLSDLTNLIYYITNPRKILLTHSNMLYSQDNTMILTQWMYHHNYHHKPTDLANHYILSFDPKCDLSSNYYFTLMCIMQDICNMDCFQNINLLMGVHKENPSSPYHVHIAADTINKVTGKRLFIERLDLVYYFGKLLEPYYIPMIGYSPEISSSTYMPIRFFSFAA